MRTPQEALRDAMPAIQALADGKAIEFSFLDRGDWKDVNNQSACQFADPVFIWRQKPQPKRTLRPWKPEEVPVGAVMRGKTINGMDRVLISAVSSGEREARIWFLCPDGTGWNGAATCAET